MNKKRIWILTLFPDVFKPYFATGVVGKTLSGERGPMIELNLVYLGDYSPKNFKGVDGAPYGGGSGVVLRADVLKSALIDGVVIPGGYDVENFSKELHVIYTTPRGKVWNNQRAKSILNDDRDLVFICGRYEGIDERFIEKYVDSIFSLGDYVLSGGELAVMAMIDSSIRFQKGVLGNEVGASEESFEEGLLEAPIYTRPPIFDGLEVPSVLLSGDHKKIAKYREEEEIRITKKYRPDLMK